MDRIARWIVVASRAHARIFSWEGRAEKMQLVREFENKAGRLKSGQLETDRPGMAFRAQGRHPMASKRPAHELAAEHFAAELASELASARTGNRVTSVVLVAEPHFMGLLRAALDGPTAALIERTIDKDLAGLGVEAIDAHLRPELVAGAVG